MTRRKVGKCKVKPQALWNVAKSRVKKDEPTAPASLLGRLGITYHPNEKANVIACYLENQVISHYPYDEIHERRIETRVQAHIISLDDTPLGKLRPSYIQKLVNSLKLGKSLWI
jgi:hypothetical protein